MESSTIILTLIVLVLPIYSFLKWLKFVTILNKIPGPKRIPFLGSVPMITTRRENLVELDCELKARYGPIYITWFGSKPFINITTAEDAEELLKDTHNITKSETFKFFFEWLGYNVLFNTGNAWRVRRKLLTPAFHFKILEDFSEVFIKKAEVLVKKLETISNDGDYIDILSIVKSCGLDIICETAMGIELNAMDDSNKKYIQCIESITELGFKRHLSPWLHNNFIFKRSKLGKKTKEVILYIHEFTNNVIKMKKGLENDDKKYLEFLDILLKASDNGRVLSDDDIKDEVNTFMFAGHDTTMSAITWFLFIIGNHEDIQKKIQEELDMILQDRSITVSDIKEMKYLDMCIKESLRLFPSVPKIGRRISHPINISGYEIPVNVNVILLIYQIHRDPNHFPDPCRFNPDNFLPENCMKRHPFAFIPFSAGLRNCIGQKFAQLEQKIILATILRKFKVKSSMKIEEMKVYHEIILKPQTEIKIKLELRQPK